jgi:orotate phosphoribosyltransferase-like protein
MAASYIKRAFDPVLLRRIALETYQVMRSVGAEVVVVRGLSGTVVATTMAALFNTPFAIVRKPNESSHSSFGLEVHTVFSEETFNNETYRDWIIVDDLISTGTTIREIKDKVDSSVIKGICKGIVLYANENSTQRNAVVWKVGRYKVPITNVVVDL